MDTTRVLVRSMQLADIHQVSDIEREAFPPPWPATNFRRELTVNTATHYLVACEEPPAATQRSTSGNPRPRKSVFHAVTGLIARLIGARPAPRIPASFIVGFAGIWFLADEAHLATIAVRSQWRRRGVGGKLLAAAIDLAVKQSARLLTLEVRASNESARAMYARYGFAEVGMRPGYYSDNKEDAILMTIDGLSSALSQLTSRLSGTGSTRESGPQAQD